MRKKEEEEKKEHSKDLHDDQKTEFRESYCEFMLRCCTLIILSVEIVHFQQVL